MVGLLMMIIVVLIGMIVYLNIQFVNERKAFNVKLLALQETIVNISNIHSGLLEQVQLSEELKESLKTNNAELSNSIFGLNFELFDLLSKNNLLKKK